MSIEDVLTQFGDCGRQNNSKLRAQVDTCQSNIHRLPTEHMLTHTGNCDHRQQVIYRNQSAPTWQSSRACREHPHYCSDPHSPCMTRSQQPQVIAGSRAWEFSYQIRGFRCLPHSIYPVLASPLFHLSTLPGLRQTRCLPRQTTEALSLSTTCSFNLRESSTKLFANISSKPARETILSHLTWHVSEQMAQVVVEDIASLEASLHSYPRTPIWCRFNPAWPCGKRAWDDKSLLFSELLVVSMC